MTKELDPKDVLAVQASVNDASSRVAGLWISFLTFSAYLSITVGSVTHEMMLKELAIKLPILSVELPVFAFFVIAPFFFLLFHFYLFLQILMLVRKINGYNKVLHERVADPEDRNAFRRRLDTFLIVQFMCGMEHEKKELSDSLLRLVAWITLVGAPVLLLLQFQLVFLPYHSGFATWIHRGVIIADLLMIWAFWFALYSPDGEIRFPPLRRHLYALVASSLVCVFSIFVMTYFGEPIGRMSPVADYFFHGPVNMVTAQSRVLFSNVLVLPYKKLVDVDELDKHDTTISLRGRDLSGAVLIGSDLRKVDFTGANLSLARLDWADAAGARFGCADTGVRGKKTSWPDEGCTWLRGASLANANLQGASFVNAHMEGCILVEAQLQGANLVGAVLQAAVLAGADLTAANLTGAKLHGAYLLETNFVGALLSKAELAWALIDASRFEAASIGSRTIGPANFSETVGVPESLKFASFKISNEKIADSSEFRSFEAVRDKTLTVLFDEALRKMQFVPKNYCELTTLRYYRPDCYGKFYEDPSNKTNWNKVKDDFEKASEQATAEFADVQDVQDRRTRALARYLPGLACDSAHAPFIARGLIQNGTLLRAGPHFPDVYEKVKSNDCKGSTGLRSLDYQPLLSYVGASLEYGDESEFPP
jgi:uncharacterized protein YjbI with pentapeptide repeats